MWRKIQKISKTNYSGKVYNIEVEDTHNYFADDILVSNCHENSLPNGKHAHIMEKGNCVIDFLNNLHPYCELAIGGGNPLCWPELDDFLLFCKEKKFIPSMTVNQAHFEAEYDRVKKLVDEKLIYGLGVSLVTPSNEFIEKVKAIPNAVIHIINGLISEKHLFALKDNALKVLILGYKEVRRGKNLYNTDACVTIDISKEMLKEKLPTIINEKWFKVVSFDNLAIKQLNVKSLLSDDEWERFYMGDDGIDGQQTSATMFFDMVERKFAKNSCSMERFDLTSTAEEMYKALKENKNV